MSRSSQSWRESIGLGRLTKRKKPIAPPVKHNPRIIGYQTDMDDTTAEPESTIFEQIAEFSLTKTRQRSSKVYDQTDGFNMSLQYMVDPSPSCRS
jgi:hypothetical protein